MSWPLRPHHNAVCSAPHSAQSGHESASSTACSALLSTLEKWNQLSPLQPSERHPERRLRPLTFSGRDRARKKMTRLVAVLLRRVPSTDCDSPSEEEEASPSPSLKRSPSRSPKRSPSRSPKRSPSHSPPHVVPRTSPSPKASAAKRPVHDTTPTAQSDAGSPTKRTRSSDAAVPQPSASPSSPEAKRSRRPSLPAAAAKNATTARERDTTSPSATESTASTASTPSTSTPNSPAASYATVPCLCTPRARWPASRRRPRATRARAAALTRPFAHPPSHTPISTPPSA